MIKKVFWFALFMSAATAYAQSSSDPALPTVSAAVAELLSSLPPDQQAKIARQADGLAKDSWTVVLAMDRGQIGATWDKASNVAKLSSRQAFMRQIFTDRGELGPPSRREQVAITFAQSEGGEVPAGLYINIRFATKFARKEHPVRELISYHLDEDQVWRVCGYSVRQDARPNEK